MANSNDKEEAFALAQADPHSSSSLVPMLVGGLVLILIGMIGVLAFS